LAAGFGGRETAPEIFFDGEFEVGGHFGVEFAVELGAAEQGTNAVKQLAKLSCHFRRSFHW